MDSALGPAAIRAAGSITGAALGRYRPVGVARVGSPEDRVQAYRRFLDTVSLTVNTHGAYYFALRLTEVMGSAPRLAGRERVRRAQNARAKAWDRHNAAEDEYYAALLGMRLCGPAPVLAAAEELGAAMPRRTRKRDGSLLPEDEYRADLQALSFAFADFLEAARHDLAYNPRPWQLLRKYRERKHRARSVTRLTARARDASAGR